MAVDNLNRKKCELVEKTDKSMEEKMKFKGIAVLVFLVAALFAVNSALAGNIVIKGSTTVLPIAQKVSEAYMKQNPDIKISISGGGPETA